MLGLLLIYFIWKYYSELAFEYNKHRWGYALLGIASYYIGTFLGGIILYVGGDLAGSDFPENISEIYINLLCMPVGILSVWGLYKLLENKWGGASAKINDTSLDGHLIDGSGPSREIK
jgi:hypothetical protein